MQTVTTAPATGAPKCLNPDCRRLGEFRGLCRNCYAQASALVRQGQTTWAALEAAGKTLPGIKRGRMKTADATREWLLSPTPTPTEIKA